MEVLKSLGWEYYLYILLMFIILIIFKIFTPKLKGWAGEKNVSSILSSLSKDSYRVINDITLSSNRGTTQIDHIVVSIYGIFVIETKNYSGWIFGSEQSDQWIKNNYGKKYNFKNPILQNYGHVMALSTLLHFDKEYFIPIVVFSSQADLKVKTKSPVVYMRALKKTILNYNKEFIKKEELDNITKKIVDSNIISRETRKKHNQTIKKSIKEKEQTINKGICPRCGGILIKRKGRYGDFVGCSKYPSCRYTTK